QYRGRPDAMPSAGGQALRGGGRGHTRRQAASREHLERGMKVRPSSFCPSADRHELIHNVTRSDRTSYATVSLNIQSPSVWFPFGFVSRRRLFERAVRPQAELCESDA